MNEFYTMRPFPISGERVLKDNEFSTANWWLVTKMENETFVFSCLSGINGGGECKVEIMKEEYELLISEKITADEICYKYDIG